MSEKQLPVVTFGLVGLFPGACCRTGHAREALFGGGGNRLIRSC